MDKRKVEFRGDVEGLRGLAAVAVVLFHLSKTWCSGGFVGVSVFFVLSGYFLAKRLNEEETSVDTEFSFTRLLADRLRRIMPPLLAVLLVVYVAALVIYPPLSPTMIVAEKMTWSALFSSANLYLQFFSDTGYFAESTALNPLMHLWSLGVEMQYLLVFPFIFKYFWWKKQRSPSALLVLITLSYMAGEAMLISNPMAAYYLLPSRGGEFLFGAAVALLMPDGLSGIGMRQETSRVLSFFAMGALVCSAFVFDEQTRFPGVLSLVPVMCTAIVIMSKAQAGVLTKFLELPALRFLGQISYSLYLVHWPLMSFLRFFAFPLTSGLNGVAVLALSLLFAYLLHTYIESNCRLLPKWSLGRTVFFLIVIPALVVGALTMGRIAGHHKLHSSTGEIDVQKLLAKKDAAGASSSSASGGATAVGFGSLSTDDETYLEHLKKLHALPHSHQCYLEGGDLGNVDISTCKFNPTGRDTSVLLIGDSQSQSHYGIVNEFAKAMGLSFHAMSWAASPPFPTNFWGGPNIHVRNRFRERIEKFDNIILCGHWAGYVRDGGSETPADRAAAITEMVDEILKSGKRLLLLGDPPHFSGGSCPAFVNEEARKDVRYKQCTDPVPATEWHKNAYYMNDLMQHLAATRNNLSYWDTSRYLCQLGQCFKYHRLGFLLLIDAFHLTFSGASVVGYDVVRQTGVPPEFEYIFGLKPRAQRK